MDILSFNLFVTIKIDVNKYIAWSLFDFRISNIFFCFVLLCSYDLRSVKLLLLAALWFWMQ